MAKFKKGQSKLPGAGRKPGSPNKVTADIRARVADFLTGDFETFKNKMRELDPDAYCRTYVALLPYVTPKQKEIQATVAGGGGFALILPNNQRDPDFNPADLDEV